MDARLSSWVKRRARTLFEAGQRARVDILPRHFYSQIPDIAALRREQQWRPPYSMHGVAGADLEAQLEFARRCSPPELREVIGAGEVYRDACARNRAVGYGPIEADFLYALARTHRPPGA